MCVCVKDTKLSGREHFRALCDRLGRGRESTGGVFHFLTDGVFDFLVERVRGGEAGGGGEVGGREGGRER